MSALEDSGCTAFATGTLDGFEGVQPTGRLMKMADKKVVRMDHEE